MAPRAELEETMIESQTEALNFVGGAWVPADSGETSEVVNPSNPSEILGTTPKSDKAETERAIEAATSALPEWKAMLPASRGAILMEAATLIEERAGEPAARMGREAGKPMKEGRMEVGRAAAIFRYYGSEGWRLDGINPPSARPGGTPAPPREPLGGGGPRTGR